MSNESKIREELWQGVPFKQALRDAIARNNTGYNYEELINVVQNPEGDELDVDEQELEQVDKTVNLLLHMFVFYHSHETPKKEQGS